MSARPMARTSGMKAACQTLRLQKLPATKADLKRHFLKLAHEHHPDKNKDGSHARMAELTKAYKTLSPLFDKKAPAPDDAAHPRNDPSDPAAWGTAEEVDLGPTFANQDRSGRVWMPWMKKKPTAVRRWETRHGRKVDGGLSLLGGFGDALFGASSFGTPPGNGQRGDGTHSEEGQPKEKTKADEEEEKFRARRKEQREEDRQAARDGSRVYRAYDSVGQRLAAKARMAPRRWLAALRYVIGL